MAYHTRDRNQNDAQRSSAPGQILEIAVVVHGDESEGCVVTAAFVGRRRNPSDETLIGMPLNLKVLGAIHWDAVKLWLEGLRM